jgi:hypothetical protein
MVFAAELFIIKALHGLVIDPRNCVAVREELISFRITQDAQNGGVADATALQEQRTPLHFRIYFAPSESGQE